MQLSTKNKKVNLVFTTRKIVNLTSMLEGKNFEDLYFKAVTEKDLNALSKMLLVFGEDEIGAKAFSSENEVYDFIDDYKNENKKGYYDIFNDLAKAINDEGFFNAKMTKTELDDKMTNPLSSLNMDEIIKNSAARAVETMTEQQIQNQ